jgi:hypothetical protein
MVDIEINREDLACAGLRRANDEWRFEPLGRPEGFMVPNPGDLAPPAPLPECIDQDIAVVRAAIAAGLSIRSATIGGVDLGTSGRSARAATM